MYLVKTPKFIQNLFPNYIWKVQETEKVLYLTFDDGPIPEVTPWVLDQLEAYNAKATFFCVGENVEKHKSIYKQLKEFGHAVANHTYNHLNGWVEDNATYFVNVRKCAALVKSDIFRPPYGKLKRKQAQFLQRHYKIVMWDVLSGDFDPKITNEECLNNVLEHAKPGSIIVFHDSLKASKKLKYTLPKVLKHYSDLGYTFQKFDGNSLQLPKQNYKIA